MLNIFKKKKPSVATISATIEQIHNEFDSASEKLLVEAKAIIAKSQILKGDRLINLGFSKSAPVEQSAEAKKKQELAIRIKHYQVYYPNNKFIDEDSVKVICQKYGLVFGDSSQYKGDVPEKNIVEMEQFKLRNEDKRRRTNMDDYLDRHRWQSFAQYSRRSFDDAPKEIKVYYTQPPFKICAPEKDFDMAFYVKKGYKLEYDPIVLQPVNGGYLIVTKWGIEASDAIVINEKQN